MKKRSKNLIDINNTRRTLTAPLKDFYAEIKNSETVEDYTACALLIFSCKCKCQKKLSQWQLNEQKDMALAKEHQQIWNNIVELFDQMVQTCGSDYISLQNYEQLINDDLIALKSL